MNTTIQSMRKSDFHYISSTLRKLLEEEKVQVVKRSQYMIRLMILENIMVTFRSKNDNSFKLLLLNVYAAMLP